MEMELSRMPTDGRKGIEKGEIFETYNSNLKKNREFMQCHANACHVIPIIFSLTVLI